MRSSIADTNEVRASGSSAGNIMIMHHGIMFYIKAIRSAVVISLNMLSIIVGNILGISLGFIIPDIICCTEFVIASSLLNVLLRDKDRCIVKRSDINYFFKRESGRFHGMPNIVRLHA